MIPNIIKEHRKKIIDILYTPSKWCREKSELININLYKYIIFFFIIGFLLNLHFYFPFFGFYICIFTTIAMIVFRSIRCYVQYFPEICALSANQKSLQPASLFYYKHIHKNPLYFWVPCAVVLVFGWGGCKIFGAIEISPLFIWVMTLFSITVYISIIGYVQYILLAIYLFKLSLKKYRFYNIRHTMYECIPADMGWIQKITKLVHIYRIAFFAIGSLYIVAFSSYCYLPAFKTVHNSPIFNLLWGIIFLAIVVTFPILSILEHIWIKKIVLKLKYSYIGDIETEVNCLKANSAKKNITKLQIYFLQNIYTQKIAESRDYPINSLVNVMFSTCLAIFNVLAIAVTIIQGIPTVLNDFLQIF